MVVSPLLAIEDLAYGYRGRVVGGGLSLALASGEVVCVLGRNGEGKSTLFKTVLGLLPALGGRVVAEGQPVERWSPRRRARIFGYVPQSGAGAFPFSVREIVTMGRTVHHGAFAGPSRADREAVERLLAGLGIAGLAERSWLRISGGERQLALFARALAQEPRILVLDEPTASLDFGNQVRVLEEMRRAARMHGLAVLFSTHHPEHAFACADRVAILAGGRLLRLGPPSEAITPETMRQCYAVEVAVLPLTERGELRVCVPRAYLDAPDPPLPGVH